MGITIINHPAVITIDSSYKPFPNGWFIIVIPTLLAHDEACLEQCPQHGDFSCVEYETADCRRAKWNPNGIAQCISTLIHKTAGRRWPRTPPSKNRAPCVGANNCQKALLRSRDQGPQPSTGPQMGLPQISSGLSEYVIRIVVYTYDFFLTAIPRID